MLERAAAAGDPALGALGATLRLTIAARAHRRIAEQTIAGLRRDLGLPILSLPRLPTVDLGPAGIVTLAARLAEGQDQANDSVAPRQVSDDEMRFAGSCGDRYRGSQRRLCLLFPSWPPCSL